VSDDLTITCERCRKPVAPGSGFLGVSLREVTRAERAEQAYYQAHPRAEAVSLSVLADEFPDDVPWRSRHYVCAPAADADAYEIAADQLRTWADLARWTAHLLGKNWLGVTDWDDMLREAAGEIPSMRICATERQAA
jgi:hypothetical protein